MNPDFRRIEDDLLKAPQLPCRPRLWRYQQIGLPLLFLFPLLALCGVFGGSNRIDEVTNDQVVLAVEFPERFRHGQGRTIRVTVRNVSPNSLDGLEVVFPPSYLVRFSHLNFTPPISDSFRVPIGDLAAGEFRMALAEVQAESAGHSQGEIALQTSAGEIARLPLRTFVFP